MSLYEKRVLSQVSILPQNAAINVQWSNQIIKDGQVISETYERKAYTQEQKSEFLTEVENAESYIAAIGW